MYLLGAWKVSWNLGEDDIDTQSVRPQRLILDPDATIVGTVYRGAYLGEHKMEAASSLIAKFPKSKDIILKELQNPEELATKLGIIEWWTPDYVFWTLKKEVLAKSKNPHWNYDEVGVPTVDANGQSTTVDKMGKNHFSQRKIPYIFLTIFNLGLHPHDDTSLIQQNLPLQDLINKRLRQIDINADTANGTWIGSGDYISKEELNKIKGRPNEKIWMETGKPSEGIMRDTGREMPGFVYQSLLDYRNEIDNIFGTHNLTRGEESRDQTVRGKLITKQSDTDRIGGGISEYLEQVCDEIFNWWVQMFYVYYDQTHLGAIIGKERAGEYFQIKNSDFGELYLQVSVKEGSLIPKDPVSERNEAIDLWAARAIDPITLFERLDFPNPRESAKQLYIWMTHPELMFPDVQQQVMQAMMGQPTDQSGQSIQPGGGVQPQIQGAAPGMPNQPPTFQLQRQPIALPPIHQ